MLNILELSHTKETRVSIQRNESPTPHRLKVTEYRSENSAQLLATWRDGPFEGKLRLTPCSSHLSNAFRSIKCEGGRWELGSSTTKERYSKTRSAQHHRCQQTAHYAHYMHYLSNWTVQTVPTNASHHHIKHTTDIKMLSGGGGDLRLGFWVKEGRLVLRKGQKRSLTESLSQTREGLPWRLCVFVLGYLEDISSEVSLGNSRVFASDVFTKVRGWSGDWLRWPPVQSLLSLV